MSALEHPATRMSDQFIFERSISRLHGLLDVGLNRDSPLFGAKLVAANAWVHEAAQRLERLMASYSDYKRERVWEPEDKVRQRQEGSTMQNDPGSQEAVLASKDSELRAQVDELRAQLVQAEADKRNQEQFDAMARVLGLGPNSKVVQIKPVKYLVLVVEETPNTKPTTWHTVEISG